MAFIVVSSLKEARRFITTQREIFESILCSVEDIVAIHKAISVNDIAHVNITFPPITPTALEATDAATRQGDTSKTTANFMNQT